MSDFTRYTAFDYMALVVVPLAVGAASLYQSKRSAVAWGLLGVAILGLVIKAVPWMRTLFLQWRERKREREISVKALDELGDFINKFGDCVSTRRSDALYNIVFGSLCGSNQANFDSLHLAPPQVFSDSWEQFKNRNESQRNSFTTLWASVAEFNTLIVNFQRYTAFPLYANVPSKLPLAMARIYEQQGIDNDLTLYRERFNKFLSDYEDFLVKLDKRLPQPLKLGYPFKPLNALKPVPDFVNEVPTQSAQK